MQNEFMDTFGDNMRIFEENCPLKAPACAQIAKKHLLDARAGTCVELLEIHGTVLIVQPTLLENRGTYSRP